MKRRNTVYSTYKTYINYAYKLNVNTDFLAILPYPRDAPAEKKKSRGNITSMSHPLLLYYALTVVSP